MKKELIIIALFVAVASAGFLFPMPRIKVSINATTGTGYFSTPSGAKFYPRAVNYVRLASTSTYVYHSTFGPSWSTNVTDALISISAYGYNMVRVFIDPGAGDRSNGINGIFNTTKLDPTYMSRVAEYVKKATQRDVYILFVLPYVPANFYYVNMTNPPDPAIGGQNNYFLNQRFINSKKAYLQDFVADLKARVGAARLSTVFAYSLDNELFFDGLSLPFSVTSGFVTTANGLTYNMSDAADRQQCGDANVVHFANSVTTVIKSVDPLAMVTIGMFTFLAVGRTGPTGFLPVPILGVTDNRFPARPAPLSIYSTLSFLDIHIYPFYTPFNIYPDLASEEWPYMNFSKPVIMGEFGAHKGAFNITPAAYTMRDLQVQSCSYSFNGWAFWTYDTTEQPEFWNILDNSGAINGQLAPIARPNPCVV